MGHENLSPEMRDNAEGLSEFAETVGIELSDEDLEAIAGGEIVNWKTKITLENYMKECRLRGLALEDAKTEIRMTYPRNERYANAFIEYISANWKY